ncbi:MAG: ThiF family adenylyltransferase [Ignavibacteriales bacterium]|nr:ThiF family adenylyltransferase [Ignavibacteriales bacterium]
MKKQLIRKDGQEDLCFALYKTGTGKERISAIINEIILPTENDRNLHGNVSFNPEFLDRVISSCRSKQMGIIFIHSHPGSGWQNMSMDDINAEKELAPRIKAATGYPLVGMTVGNDGSWSGRFWNKTAPKFYTRVWCESVRVVGDRFNITFDDNQFPKFGLIEELTRTISAWGQNKQAVFSKLKVGIVGLGSVGSQIAEALLRTGVAELKLIDFDIIEKKNLDRLHGANSSHIGLLKSNVFCEILNKNRLFPGQRVTSVPYSIVEKEGFESAIDCDIVFSCVDRPWPRFILNMIAYAYLIPVIDGGISASINSKGTNLYDARSRTFTVTPTKRCMKCMGQYRPEDVSLEQTGMLEDPKYISGLAEDHFALKGENVYAFSLGLASIQVQQFLGIVLAPKGRLLGPKEMDFISGTIDSDFPYECENTCEMPEIVGIADDIKNILITEHKIAKQRRENANELTAKNGYNHTSKGVISFIKAVLTKILYYFNKQGNN